MADTTSSTVSFNLYISIVIYSQDFNGVGAICIKASISKALEVHWLLDGYDKKKFGTNV